MDQQPSKFAIVFRLFIFIFIVCFIVMFLFTTFPIILATAACLTVFYIVVHGGIVNGVTNLIYGRDPDYQQYKKMGGNPYLDTLPPPINRTGNLKTYTMPNPEPEYRNFVPPRWWNWQCNSCFARVEFPTGDCWNCGVKLD